METLNRAKIKVVFEGLVRLFNFEVEDGIEISVLYNSNGGLQTVGLYKDSKACGEVVKFNYNGKMIIRNFFAPNGKLHKMHNNGKDLKTNQMYILVNKYPNGIWIDSFISIEELKSLGLFMMEMK